MSGSSTLDLQSNGSVRTRTCAGSTRSQAENPYARPRRGDQCALAPQGLRVRARRDWCVRRGSATSTCSSSTPRRRRRTSSSRSPSWNRGRDPATLHVLPTLWFRNVWSWGGDVPRPVLRQAAPGVIAVSHPELGERLLSCEGAAALLFTENETNTERLFRSAQPDAVRQGRDQRLPRRRAPRGGEPRAAGDESGGPLSADDWPRGCPDPAAAPQWRGAGRTRADRAGGRRAVRPRLR